jgi:hypothetical protein
MWKCVGLWQVKRNFCCKTKLLPLYRINSRGKGNECDILLSWLCFMGPMTCAVSTDEFYCRVYGAVSHNWNTVATVYLTCIAHLRIRMQSIKICWTFAFIIIFLPNGLVSLWYSTIMFRSSWFLSQPGRRLSWSLKWILSAPSEKFKIMLPLGHECFIPNHSIIRISSTESCKSVPNPVLLRIEFT